MKTPNAKIVYLLFAAAICFASCSVSKSNQRKSLADKIEKRDRKPKPKPQKPVAQKPQKPTYQGKLMSYCEGWIGTPYRSGGETKQGVDCSGFVSNVYKDVYGISLPRRSQDMEKACQTTKSLQTMREGDLVFFNNVPGGSTNHVGIFIDKETFIHASTSKGVTISRFDEKYWSERFRCGGKYPGKK